MKYFYSKLFDNFMSREDESKTISHLVFSSDFYRGYATENECSSIYAIATRLGTFPVYVAADTENPIEVVYIPGSSNG